jgi:hypothetical protein
MMQTLMTVKQILDMKSIAVVVVDFLCYALRQTSSHCRWSFGMHWRVWARRHLRMNRSEYQVKDHY